MKTPAMALRTKKILILSMLLIAVGGNLAAQSETKDRTRKRAHRIFAAQTGRDQVTLAWDEVPGTREYRIYLPDPNKPGPPQPGSRPTISLSGSGRLTIVTGVSRMAAGAYLEALGDGGVLYRGMFNAITVAPLVPPKAPAAVQARQTSETEVTLSWDPVPGATAYMISRAVGGSGWKKLCDVCPPSEEFVDTTATPGLEHSYSVAAIFPLGISTRTSSNRLAVGAAQLAAATAIAPPAAEWDKPMSTGTPVAGTDADYTNVGESAGIPATGTTTGTGTTTTTGWTPGGVPAGTSTTTQLPACGSGPAHGATPVASTPTTPAAAYGSQNSTNPAESPDMTVSLREGLRQDLVAPPPLPPGAEPRYQPLNEGAIALSHLETDPAKAEQRAQKLSADLKTIAPVERLPVVGTVEFAKLRADALAIVKGWYQESRDALEPDAAGEFARGVTWTPDFSVAPRTVSPAERERARQASYSVAYAITHLDRPRFIVVYAAAIFALNPDGALEAGNAASAIVTSGERLYGTAASAPKLAACRDDAAVVYRYALACSVVNGKWTLRSLGILINLGNLYVDMNSPERARPVLLAARVFAPNSWDAALALASCYMLQERPELARAALEDKSIARSALYTNVVKGSAQLDAVRSPDDLSPDSSEEECDAALKTFEGKETLTAADFVAPIDPSERDRMRRFVDNLPVQGSYRAPEINGLTQFSTLKSISTPEGFRALSDFQERLGTIYLPLYGHMVQGSTDMLARLGLNVKANVDLNDVMAHPERYKNANINIAVTGTEELKARAEAMKAQAGQMEATLQSGNMATIARPSPIALTVNPALAIHLLKPFDYANPMDVMMQQYNISMLALKSYAYNTSILATNRRTRATLEEIRERHAKNRSEIRAMYELEMAMFQKRKAEAERSGTNITHAQWRLMEHNIHTRFMNEYNARAEYEWKEATMVAAKAYADKIKPRAERFYYDVFRHIALISDPEAREKKNREFEQMLILGVGQGLENVLGAFGSMPYVQEWDCHCNIGSLLADAEREERELEQIRQEQEAREQQERLRFESGDIPPSSPLFQKLDAYGTDLNIPFIPLLSGRVSLARTTLTLAAEFPTSLSPKGTYTFTKNAFTGATTHAAGLEISVSGEEGSLSAGATLNVQGSISLDGHGTVTDYSVTGAGTVHVDVGPVSGQIGAEIGYTSTGGLTADAYGGLTAVLEGAYGRSTAVTIEASARRGNTLSVKAEQELNPYSGEIDSFLRDVSEESMGDKFPFSTSVTKELWSGKFTL